MGGQGYLEAGVHPPLTKRRGEGTACPPFNNTVCLLVCSLERPVRTRSAGMLKIESDRLGRKGCLAGHQASAGEGEDGGGVIVSIAD